MLLFMLADIQVDRMRGRATDEQYAARLRRFNERDDEAPEVFEYKPMRPLTDEEEERENW